ncbi:hypothetical protein [Ornithinimicrobium murale]|uniref:hypothetical protein n=1 Tax=Ornithinimicrobium murale TaxID=1050153 RepID=UPI0013B3CF00|nr:hypothetical protein [Ornithinimicrobium murale]
MSTSPSAATAREQNRDPSGRFGHQSAAESDVQLDGPDWRDRPVVVRGRRFTVGQVRGGRFFHGTIAALGPGERLSPGAARANHAQSDADTVSITSDEATARHWAIEAARAKGLDPGHAVVLEVEPAPDLDPWRVTLAERGTSFDVLEARTSSATVIGAAQ